MNTRRDSKRIAIKLQGNYRVWESDFPFAVITVVNISHTGICFRTDHQVKTGYSVELKLNLASQETLSLLAQVIWSNPIAGSDEYDTGIKIMNVNSYDAKKFVKFYKEKLMYPPA